MKPVQWDRPTCEQQNWNTVQATGWCNWNCDQEFICYKQS